MQIFDEIKQRGIECGAKEIFKDVIVHRYIVYLIITSLKYVPSKDYKKFTANLKLIYGASLLKLLKMNLKNLNLISLNTLKL